MGKVEVNKEMKKNALYRTAFELFTTQGIAKTTISDIVQQAGVAKGTFYLYFKDKYDINNKLVIHRASKLFDDAMEHMRECEVEGYRDRILFVINDIIDALTQDKVLLMFISKNLGLGFSRYAMESPAVNEDNVIREAAEQLLADIGDEIKEPRLMMYMIIELTGSSIYSSILYDQPVRIDEFKPYLYGAINSIIDRFAAE